MVHGLLPPVSDFVGTVTLTYAVSDGNVAGWFQLTHLDVLAVNDAPVMTSGTIPVLTLLEDAPLSSMGLTGLSFSVGGGSDESSQSLTYQATVMPDAAGTVYNLDGVTPVSAGDFLSLTELQNLKLLPAASSTGSFQFKFTVFDDGSGVSPSVNSSTETLYISILNFNDVPVLPASPISITNAAEDTPYRFNASDLLNGVTDPDISYDSSGNSVDNPFGDVLTISNLSSTNGTVSGPDGSGNYTFTPNDDYNGIANFNYLISDGQGGSISNSVNLTIDPVNDQPIATFTIISQYSTESTAVLNGQLTATDTDISRGEAATSSLVYSIDGAAIDGLTINANGSFSFDPTHPSYNYLSLNQQLVITVPYKSNGWWLPFWFQ